MSLNVLTRLAMARRPFAAVPSDGRPMTPDVVWPAMPSVSKCGRSALQSVGASPDRRHQHLGRYLLSRDRMRIASPMICVRVSSTWANLVVRQVGDINVLHLRDKRRGGLEAT